MYTKTSHLALSFQGSYSRKGEGSDDRYALVVWALQVIYCPHVSIFSCICMHVFLNGGPSTTHVCALYVRFCMCVCAFLYVRSVLPSTTHRQTRRHIQITYKCTYIHTNTRKKNTCTTCKIHTHAPRIRVLDTLLDTLGSGSEAGHGEL